MQNKVAYNYTVHYNYVLSRLIFSVAVSISNSQKLIEWIYRKVEEYRKPEKLCEPTQHN